MNKPKETIALRGPDEPALMLHLPFNRTVTVSECGDVASQMSALLKAIIATTPEFEIPGAPNPRELAGKSLAQFAKLLAIGKLDDFLAMYLGNREDVCQNGEERITVVDILDEGGSGTPTRVVITFRCTKGGDAADILCALAESIAGIARSANMDPIKILRHAAENLPGGTCLSRGTGMMDTSAVPEPMPAPPTTEWPTPSAWFPTKGGQA